VRTFGTAQVQEVYRVLLDRDALLLESIGDVIKEKGINDGEVLVTAGSVQECTYHYVTSTEAKAKNAYKTVKGPIEILNAGGIIAAGEPHIHITLSSLGKPAFGGHLEKGCKVLYLAEVTILKYSGPALVRKENANGISLLEGK
jgi:predicted DNA-binding protein with PD1-like motif